MNESKIDNVQFEQKLNNEQMTNCEQSPPADAKPNVMRRAIGVFLNGQELQDGDIVAQHCQMVDDYTGKTSVELNRLLICWNGKKWDVKCIDACIGYSNNFWGYLPRFDELVGNAIDNADWLPRGGVWQPYA